MQKEYQKKEDDYIENHETLPQNILTLGKEKLSGSQQQIAKYYQDFQINLENKNNEGIICIETKANKAIQTVGEECQNI